MTRGPALHHRHTRTLQVQVAHTLKSTHQHKTHNKQITQPTHSIDGGVVYTLSKLRTDTAISDQ